MRDEGSWLTVERGKRDEVEVREEEEVEAVRMGERRRETILSRSSALSLRAHAEHQS